MGDYGLSKLKRVNASGVEKKPLSPQTIKVYVGNFNSIKMKFLDMDKPDDYSWVMDFKEIDKFLEAFTPNTRRNKYASLLMVLQAMNIYPEAQKYYNKKQNDLNEQYNKFQETGKPLESQKAKYVDKSEVEKMIKDIESDLKKNDTRDLKQAYILFKLYSKIPRRNDFGNLKFISDMSKLTEDERKANNYFDGKDLYINQYKTSAKYAEQKIVLTKSLSNLLKQFVSKYKIKDNQALFINTSGGDLTTNNLTKLLNRVSQKYLGKNISTTMLAKIYMADFAGANEKIKEKAKQRGNSSSMMTNVYIKDFS
jgi:hypothetical protein